LVSFCRDAGGAGAPTVSAMASSKSALRSSPTFFKDPITGAALFCAQGYLDRHYTIGGPENIMEAYLHDYNSTYILRIGTDGTLEPV
jgi:hypothetical protein